jgi:molybdopterin-guanine dinucleotide biosynthesis protein B
MQRIHVVGRKNHGKTRLVTALVQHLSGLGLRVGTIKHTHHRHELDTEGKDSWQHRQAGAALVGVLSEQLTAIFLPTPGGSDGTGVGQQGQQEQGRGDNRAGPTEDSRYATLEPLYADCDLVIVEGNLRTSAPKIEVWREELGTEPLYTSDAGIEVVVTDSPLTLTPPRFTLLPTAIESLADWVLYRVREKTG